MEAIFNTTGSNQPIKQQAMYEQGNRQQEENAKRNGAGQPTQGGEGGHAQVGSKDPHDFDPSGGPGSMGNKPVQDLVL
ncbi:hypothetical protein K437DRAFT_260013 [Tilletiaria anomala UBC 951]|uniref:Uncharacterized protein n=1 Tax=Tilletiaria anomala (strain ATCC 24038 / CBS 436.72 / UBC 951) TaxID=1037660 RepID=A0A066VDX8_TILAU|nr:uncharacterized protein K437DRAFT_260013 [Tilletiaria anomala UBC 951]KDN36785.1 hypothetical protein K437DRAFT_260013 [Tilletiaria anomala UBC 951]